MIFVLIVLYAVPLICLVLYPFPIRFQFGRLHAFMGRTEWFFSFTRDFVLAAGLLIYALYNLMFFLTGKASGFPFVIPVCFACVGLSIWCFFCRRRRVREFLDSITAGGPVKPAVFFGFYFSSISGLPGRLPDSLPEKMKLHARTLPAGYRLSALPLVWGIFYTSIITRLVVRASKWRGADYCERLADMLAVIWAQAIVEKAGINLEVLGSEKLEGISGRSVFVCNHKSFIDFVVVPLAIGFVELKLKRGFKPRYMAARDHFIDNPFLYRVIGMGRALEKIGTVFVDRKAKKRSAVSAVSDAADAMVKRNVDIVMFPQGTRAHGNVDQEGGRLDAGYYTTIRLDKLSSERGHIKKGAAYLAVDAARRLEEKGIKLNIIPVGLKGPGIVVPREKFRIQKGVRLEVIFGRPIELSADADVEDVYIKIDEVLKEVIGLHKDLKKRLVVDLRRMMNEAEISRFFEALDAWASEENLLFSIIDCIYSSPARLWKSFFRQMYQLISEMDTTTEELMTFKEGVVKEMVGRR